MMTAINRLTTARIIRKLACCNSSVRCGC
jgi:hypothetical protein